MPATVLGMDDARVSKTKPCTFKICILLRKRKKIRNYIIRSLQLCGVLLSILVCHEGAYWEDLTSLGVPEGLSEEIKFKMAFG